MTIRDMTMSQLHETADKLVERIDDPFDRANFEAYLEAFFNDRVSIEDAIIEMRYLLNRGMI